MTAPGPPAAGPPRRNLVLLYGGEALTKALALGTFAWLTRVLGAEAYGDLEFGIGVLFVLNLLVEAGLGPYGAREAARAPAEAAAIAGRIAGVRVLVLAAAAALLLAAVPWLPRERQRVLTLACALVLVPSPFALPWVFQARDEMGVVALSSLLRQLVQTALVVLLVASPADAPWVPAADALGLALAVVLQAAFFARRVGPLRSLFRWHGFTGSFRAALPLAASALVWALRWFAPLLLLGLLAGARTTGWFAAAHRLAFAAHTFVWLWFFNLLPSLARAAGEADRSGYRRLQARSHRRGLALAVPAGLLAAGIAPWLLPRLNDPSFGASVVPFQVLLLALLFAFLSGHQRFGLIALGRQADDLRANAAGAIVVIAGGVLLRDGLDEVRAAVLLVAGEAITWAAALVLHGRAAGTGADLPAAGAMTPPKR